MAFRIDTRAPQTAWTDPSRALTDTVPTSSAASVGLSAGAQPQLPLAGDGTVAVPVTCAAASNAPCAGQVTVQEQPTGSRSSLAARAATTAGAVLGARTSYLVAPGSTQAVRLRLADAARFKVERRGLLRARALVTQDGGSAAPVPLTLIAIPRRLACSTPACACASALAAR